MPQGPTVPEWEIPDRKVPLQLCGVWEAASVRARSRDLRAGPDQPHEQRARQNEPRSTVEVMCGDMG